MQGPTKKNPPHRCEGDFERGHRDPSLYRTGTVAHRATIVGSRGTCWRPTDFELQISSESEGEPSGGDSLTAEATQLRH